MQMALAMISPVSQSTNFAMAAKLLDAAVLRQEAIAANIANAETPGFRRLDVSPDFMRELKASVSRGGGASSLQHLSPRLVADEDARSLRSDGNTVEIEREMLEMNRNTVSYEFLTDYVSGSFKQLKMAIRGRAS